MPPQQVNRQRGGKPVHVEPPVRIPGFQFRLQRPADMLNLAVAHLKAIDQLHALCFAVRLLGNGAQEILSYHYDQRRVCLLHFPTARDAYRHQVDIAMHAEPAMTISAPIARNVYGPPDVNQQKWIARRRSLNHAGRIALHPDVERACGTSADRRTHGSHYPAIWVVSTTDANRMQVTDHGFRISGRLP